MSRSGSGPGLHPRNRHRGRYDFAALVAVAPELARYVAPNAHGEESIDFADGAAVRALNRAILARDYGVAHWALPPGALCPPIPGRADLIHHVADLLALEGEVPRGAGVRVLDVGTGASCIYPLLGHAEYGWSFVASELNAESIESARRIVAANGLERAIELRPQSSADRIFGGVIEPGERFDLTVCNPPFHASAAEARAATARKSRNLGKPAAALNFGGQGAELWAPGGERGFVGRMIQESVAFRDQVGWFSALVSKAENLGTLESAIRKAGARARTREMAQGQKRSRVLAWSFSR